MQAEVSVNQFRRGGLSVFGAIGRFHLKLAGEFRPDRFVVGGHMLERPDRPIGIEFVRRVELP